MKKFAQFSLALALAGMAGAENPFAIQPRPAAPTQQVLTQDTTGPAPVQQQKQEPPADKPLATTQTRKPGGRRRRYGNRYQRRSLFTAAQLQLRSFSRKLRRLFTAKSSQNGPV
jgi:hypothetical protein